jgi:hypothetical protein
MTVTIDLPAELEQPLRLHAERRGQDLAAVILEAIREKLDKTRSLDEICAPFAKAVEASGMTDEEFDGFFEKARDEAWHQRQSRAS